MWIRALMTMSSFREAAALARKATSEHPKSETFSEVLKETESAMKSQASREKDLFAKMLGLGKQPEISPTPRSAVDSAIESKNPTPRLLCSTILNSPATFKKDEIRKEMILKETFGFEEMQNLETAVGRMGLGLNAEGEYLVVRKKSSILSSD